MGAHLGDINNMDVFAGQDTDFSLLFPDGSAALGDDFLAGLTASTSENGAFRDDFLAPQMMGQPFASTSYPSGPAPTSAQMHLGQQQWQWAPQTQGMYGAVPSGLPPVTQSRSSSGSDCPPIKRTGSQERKLEEAKQKASTSSAQKRFRARQKEKMVESARQLEEMNRKMAELMREKADLENHQHVMAHIMSLQEEHLEKLFSNQVVCTITQTLLLEEMAALVSKVKQRAISLQEAKTWTMGQWVTSLYEEYIQHISKLYDQCLLDPSSPAHDKLTDLVVMRRKQEEQGSLVSANHWAVYGWNVEESKSGLKPPGEQHWSNVLTGLRLTKEQESALLEARRALVLKLTTVSSQRRNIISQLGLELLATPKEEMHTCPAAGQLKKSLEAERVAVFSFIFTVLDSVLTPIQEAYLDIQSYPWCPDVWAMLDILAHKRAEPTVAMPDMELGASAALAPIMPHATAFKFLTMPILARGVGLRLKRGICMCPFETTAPAAAFPLPDQALLRDMTLLDVHCGKWKQQTYWEWVQTCQKANRNVPNRLVRAGGQDEPAAA